MQYVNRQYWSIPNVGFKGPESGLLDILTQDCDGKMAVYRVIVHEAVYLQATDEDYETWAHQGMKLPYKVAKGSFPCMPEEKYRI